MSVTLLTKKPLYAIKRTVDISGIGQVHQYMNFTTGMMEIVQYPGSRHVTDSLPLATALYNQDDYSESIEILYLTRRP